MLNTQSDVYMGQTYNSSFPYWLRLLTFLKRGLYNGKGWSIRWGRILCWFDRHSFTDSYSAKVENFSSLSIHIKCSSCGQEQPFTISHNDLWYKIMGNLQMKPSQRAELKEIMDKSDA